MIIFRCSAGPQLGIGHLMRCRSLAIALKQKGLPCVMVGPALEYREKKDHEVFDKWIVQDSWHSEQDDALSIVNIAKDQNASAIVVDDYRIQENYQLTLRKSGIPWLQFDYNAKKRLWADIVVNANPAALSFDYKSQSQNKDIKLLLGPRYAILRPEFPPKEMASRNDEVKRILVTFGGGDDRGAIEFVLPIILTSTKEDVKIVVVSGERNPRNITIQEHVNKYGQGRVELHINPSNIAHVFASCDLAVMSAGTSTHEAAACGLPMLLITIAENQERQANAWAENGAAIYLGDIEAVLEKDFSNILTLMLNNLEVANNMALISKKLVDGRGSIRVSQELESIIT